MHAAGGPQVRLRGLDDRERPVPVVRTDEDHVDIG